MRLGALKRNFARLDQESGASRTGAAVKADGYGLGATTVVRTLWDAGCREFFVASVDEGIEVRQALTEVAAVGFDDPSANINVFNGAMPGTTDELVAHDLVPLAISLEQLDGWRAAAAAAGRTLPVGLHFDTGMGRTGFTQKETSELIDSPHLLDGLDVRHVMSHMACADDRFSAQPEDQLERFRHLRTRFPAGMASLANSAGIFRSPDYHFDLVRPGISIYGGMPIAEEPNPMEHTIVLEAPILQIKEVRPGDKVGYGATYEIDTDTRHVVVPVGYADGYLRSASNTGSVAIGDTICPIVGRVSMDLTIIDASAVPEDQLHLGAPVEMIGSRRSVDEVAAVADTIANELLTELGSRYERVYTHD